ncbi:MAG TPA: hypothetical protein VE093_02670 [Polyangiaceae bacterium]|nr:hypothetical protein [Polyangiaceae bacterium]
MPLALGGADGSRRGALGAAQRTGKQGEEARMDAGSIGIWSGRGGGVARRAGEVGW